MQSLFWCKKHYFPLRGCKLSWFTHCRISPTMKFAKIGDYLSIINRVWTRAIFPSKGSFGNEEPKNAILLAVQITYFPLRGCKLPGFTHRRIEPTKKFAEIGGCLSTKNRVCTNAIFTSKRSYGNVEPENATLVSLQIAYFPLQDCKLPELTHRHIGPTIKFAKIGGYFSTWYRVCTKGILTSKGSYGNVEPKNAILVSVQKGYFRLRACKLTLFTNRRKEQTMNFAEIGGHLFTWYRVCTKAKFTSKGSYGNVEPKNAILVSVQKAYFPLRGCKLSG